MRRDRSPTATRRWNSSAKAVLPIPGSPVIKTICRSPLRARRHASYSIPRAPSRPTKELCADPPDTTGLEEAVVSDTSAINRYPRLGKVSMKREFLGRSPSAARTSRMCFLTACGSITLPDHAASSNSSGVTRHPACSTRYARTAKAFGVSRMRSSCPASAHRQRHWFAVSSRKGRNTFIGCLRAPPAWKPIQNKMGTPDEGLPVRMRLGSKIERKASNADREGSLLRPGEGNDGTRHPDGLLRRHSGSESDQAARVRRDERPRDHSGAVVRSQLCG